jgi:Septum formation
VFTHTRLKETTMTITSTPWGRALAVTTVATATLALAGCSLLGNIVSGNDSGTDTGPGTDTDVFTIVVGDCLNDGSLEGEVSTVRTIDCAEPHDSEAYASIIMTDGEFPGDQAVQDQATADCTTQFSTFVGLAYAESIYNFSYYYPTAASWAQGDREILCLIIDEAGKTTGSLAGIAR